jgi:hypothetical protein
VHLAQFLSWAFSRGASAVQVAAPESWGWTTGHPPQLRAFVRALDEKFINAVQVRWECLLRTVGSAQVRV